MVNGRATVNIYSTKEYRVAGDGELDNPALLSITGPKATLINAIYQPLHFKKPPVPYPVFADIFDSRGKKSSVELNMKEPYFQMAQDYLDGIADSLVIYYNRPFRLLLRMVNRSSSKMVRASIVEPLAKMENSGFSRIRPIRPSRIFLMAQPT